MGARMTTDGYTVSTLEQLRGLLGDVGTLSRVKSLTALDGYCRTFLEHSTFCTIASTSTDGDMDVSPKGDPAGFALVLDDATIAIPERPGNRRCDTFTNVLGNPAVALIFLVPGVDETLRINGTATISTNPELLYQMTIGGNTPKVALVVQVREAFVHCGKALSRGRVWDPTAQLDRTNFPTMGEMLHAHANADQLGLSRDTVTQLADNDYKNNLY